MASTAGTIRCKKCGATLDEVARFCVECGTPVDAAVTGAGQPMRAPVVAKEERRGPLSRRTLKLDLTASAPPASEDGSARSMSEALASAVPEKKARPASRPEAPAARPPSDEGAPISAILGDLDSSFEAMITEGAAQGPAGGPQDLREVQTLFKQIASEYAAPVRGFLVELRLGDTSKDWIQICLPAVTSMAQSAEKMGLEELARALGELRAALENAEWAAGAGVTGEARARLLAAADTLVRELPEAFAVEREADQREPVIVRSLLAQVPGVRKVQLDRIYRAGLGSLQMFLVASPRELADATGLELELCDRIVSRFKRYRTELLAGPGDAARSGDLASIGALAKELVQLNAAYDRDKKRVRQRRNDLMNEVNVLLARVGAVALVEQLERLPFQRKAEQLERFVNERLERAK